MRSDSSATISTNRNQFDLATLAVVCEQSKEDIAMHLWRSLQMGLIIPESEIYKFFQDSDWSV